MLGVDIIANDEDKLKTQLSQQQKLNYSLLMFFINVYVR